MHWLNFMVLIIFEGVDKEMAESTQKLNFQTAMEDFKNMFPHLENSLIEQVWDFVHSFIVIAFLNKIHIFKFFISLYIWISYNYSLNPKYNLKQE